MPTSRYALNRLPLLYAAAVVVAYAAPATFSQAAKNELRPVWDRTVAAGIEWSAPADGEPARAVLICDKNSRLDMIDVETGRGRLADPIHVQPGTQFAGASGPLAYCYGPTLVYAIRVKPVAGGGSQHAREAWRVTAAPDAQTEGDPEFMTRLIAAAATPRGVLIVRSDGRVAELSSDDGGVIWKRELGELSSCTLHVYGATAALVWKHGAATEAAFFDLSSESPKPHAVELSDPPIWSQLTDIGLAAVGRQRCAIARPHGPVDWFELTQGAVPGSGASIAVRVVRNQEKTGNDPLGNSPSAILFVANYDALLFGYEIPGGRVRIGRDRLTMRISWAVQPGPTSLLNSGDYLVASNQHGVCVYQASDGELVEDFGGAGGLSGCARDGFAYGLFLKPERPIAARNDLFDDQPEPPEPSVELGSIRLMRQILSGQPWPRSDEPVNPDIVAYNLGDATQIRDVYWLGETIVIVEQKRLRAYALP